MTQVLARVDEDPRVAEARGRCEKLGHELAALEDRLAKLNAALAEKANGAGELRSPADAVAARMADGERIETVGVELRRAREQLRDVTERLPVVRRAIEVAKDRHREEIARASKLICARHEAEHRKRVKALAQALATAAEANQAYVAFRDGLEQGGVLVHSYLPNAIFTALGDPRDASSRLAHWFTEQVKQRYLDKGDVPAAWRKKWGL